MDMPTSLPPAPARRRRRRGADVPVDVVVVGGRAAGAATAHLLARAGLEVAVLERGAYGADTLSTHGLMRAGVVQLARWGLLERIVAAGTPAIRRTTFRYGGEVVPVEVKPAHGIDALYAPRRTVLDAVLADAAVEAGADVRFATSVRGLLRGGDGRVVGVTGRGADGRAFELRSRLVVGADGIRSLVAREVGAPVERAGRVGSAVVYGYWSDLPVDGYEWNFRPRAASGAIPTNGGRTCVFVGAPLWDIGRGGPDVLRRILTDSAPDLAARVAAAPAPTGLRTFAGAPGHVRRSHGPGWALVGDAGYFKDPLSAHGLTDAMRDAELLARAAVDVLVGGAAERDALAAYQARRDELSADLFDVVDVIAGHRWTDDTIGPLLRRLNAAMAAELDALVTLPPFPGLPTAA